MKKQRTLLLLFLLVAVQVFAGLKDWRWQEVEYHFDSSGPNGTLTVLINYWMGDTVVYNGITYNKLYQQYIYQDSTPMHPTGIFRKDTISCYSFREDASGRIYTYQGKNVPEKMSYDFSPWSYGDTLRYCGRFEIVDESNLDSILLLDGSYAQRVAYGENLTIIRGIGFTDGFLLPIAPVPGSFMGGMIVSFYKGNQLIWKNPDYVSLQKTSAEEGIRAYSLDGRLVVEVPSAACKLEVYSLAGSLLQTCKGQGSNVIESAPLPPGLYLYSVIDGNGSTIARNKMVVR